MTFWKSKSIRTENWSLIAKSWGRGRERLQGGWESLGGVWWYFMITYIFKIHGNVNQKNEFYSM
jgi:hypothetical protein